MKGLTDRQATLLDFIACFIAEHGYPPTQREIGHAMNIRSTTGVKEHLLALVRKGAIATDPRISRGIRVLPKAPC